MWQFEGEAGTFISLAMEGIEESVDAYLELLDGNGTLLEEDDDGGEGYNSKLMYLLPTSGRYFIRTTSISTPGSYELTLTRQELPTLRFGQTVTSSTDVETLWQFEGEAGTFVSLAMDGIDESVDAYLELLDGNGTLLEEDDDGGDGLNSWLMRLLSRSDRYIVRTTSIDAPGRYELTLNRQEPSALRLGQTVTSSTSEDVLWQFEGEAGTFISLAMDGFDEDFDAYLQLMDANYTLLAEDDDGGENWNSRLAHFLPASDRYFVRATSIGIEGRYDLTLTDIEPGTLSDSEIITATTDTQILWQFEGQAGEFISLSMNGIDEDFDAYLQLMDANYTLLAEDDDGGENWNSHLSYSLPASGRYFVRATSIGTQGDYELTLTRNEPDNTDN
jgi:hypothetical protein